MNDRELEIYTFINSYTNQHGYAPTVREISKGVYLSSNNAICKHLDNLSQKGYLRHTPKTPRSIVILKPA